MAILSARIMVITRVPGQHAVYCMYQYCDHSKHNIDPMLKQCWSTVYDAGLSSACRVRVPSVLGKRRAIHECGTFPTTFFQVYFNLSDALSVIYK